MDYQQFFIGLYIIIIMDSCSYGDNLALLSATLRTYYKTACDSDKVQLACPRGTSITIEFAQYEKSKDGTNSSTCRTKISNTESNSIESPANNKDACYGTTNYLQNKWKDLNDTTWVRYSLLQTAVEACQKKTHCKFSPSSKSMEGNPCNDMNRSVEFAYKCRPYEFRSKIACANDIIQLVCNPYSRIAIYGATYGRTEYESIQCSQPQGVKEETCLAAYATETVMGICHGRRKCTISADTDTFGNPCKPDSRLYLKTVYTCVPLRVLNDKFEALPETDEPMQDLFHEDNESYDEDLYYRESEAIPPEPKLQGNLRTNHTNLNRTNVEHTIVKKIEESSGKLETNWLEENQHFLYLYVFIASLILILLCVIIIVIVRIMLAKRTSKLDIKSQTSNTCVTTHEDSEHTYNEDNELDLTAPMSISSISREDHMYSNTYIPSSFGNLDPGSITYTLVPSTNLITGQPTLVTGASHNLYDPMHNLRPPGAVTFHTNHPVLLSTPSIIADTYDGEQLTYVINTNPHLAVTNCAINETNNFYCGG